MSQYPNSIHELDLDSCQFPPAAVEAMRKLARSRPWRGSISERKQKLLTLAVDLSAAYGVPVPRVTFDLRGEDSGGSCYYPDSRTIILRGAHLSVISMAHELFHHILGPSEHEVCRHSLSLFKRCFPLSWERLCFEGHMARRRSVRGNGGGHQ